MLETIGCKSLDDLIQKTIPKEILTNVLFLFRVSCVEDEVPCCSF